VSSHACQLPNPLLMKSTAMDGLKSTYLVGEHTAEFWHCNECGWDWRVNRVVWRWFRDVPAVRP